MSQSTSGMASERVTYGAGWRFGYGLGKCLIRRWIKIGVRLCTSGMTSERVLYGTEGRLGVCFARFG